MGAGREICRSAMIVGGGEATMTGACSAQIEPHPPFIPAQAAVNLSMLGDFGRSSTTLCLMVRRRAIAGAACVHLAAMRGVSKHEAARMSQQRGHPILRDALLRNAPQDEVGPMEGFTAT